jgi:predicted DCC family thiol-disulfide oxidoreductase YuxK
MKCLKTTEAADSSACGGAKREPGESVPELSVLYDGACGLCRASVVRVRSIDPGGRIELVDLHDPGAAARFPQVNREEAMRWMQAVDRGGRVYSGADAWARIGLALPGWKLVAWLLLVPGIHFVAGRVYGWVARNRYRWNHDLCADGSCALHTGESEAPAVRRAPRD